MNNFDRLYNILMNEGKANPADKKGSKHGWNKHRNKWESKQSNKTSRRQGKKETMEESYYEEDRPRRRSPLLKDYERGGFVSSSYSSSRDDNYRPRTVADMLERGGFVSSSYSSSRDYNYRPRTAADILDGRRGGENNEERDRTQDYMDLHYNLKDYLDSLAREVEKYYHHYNSIDTEESSDAALLCNVIIDRLDEINEGAQGEGTREEFVELKDKVEAFMRELSSEYESFGPEQQSIVDMVIDALDEELDSY